MHKDTKQPLEAGQNSFSKADLDVLLSGFKE